MQNSVAHLHYFLRSANSVTLQKLSSVVSGGLALSFPCESDGSGISKMEIRFIPPKKKHANDVFWQKVSHSIRDYKNAQTHRQCIHVFDGKKH